MVPGTSTANRNSSTVPTWLALLLVTLSLGVAAGAVVAVARGSGPGDPSTEVASVGADVLPSVLAGLPTTVHLRGPEAVEAIARLHIGDVDVDAAEISDYGGGRIVVWVSWSASEGAAAQVERMTARIGEGGTPFSTPETAEAPDGAYVTTGNGQVHYYWAQDGGVWWLAADRGLAQAALDDLIGDAG